MREHVSHWYTFAALSNTEEGIQSVVFSMYRKYRWCNRSLMNQVSRWKQSNTLFFFRSHIYDLFFSKINFFWECNFVFHFVAISYLRSHNRTDSMMALGNSLQGKRSRAWCQIEIFKRQAYLETSDCFNHFQTASFVALIRKEIFIHQESFSGQLR